MLFNNANIKKQRIHNIKNGEKIKVQKKVKMYLLKSNQFINKLNIT